MKRAILERTNKLAIKAQYTQIEEKTEKCTFVREGPNLFIKGNFFFFFLMLVFLLGRLEGPKHAHFRMF